MGQTDASEKKPVKIIQEMSGQEAVLMIIHVSITPEISVVVRAEDTR